MPIIRRARTVFYTVIIPLFIRITLILYILYILYYARIVLLYHQRVFIYHGARVNITAQAGRGACKTFFIFFKKCLQNA